MAKDRADARWAWMLFIAGLAALSLLLVPDIALYAVCGHIVRALVSFFMAMVLFRVSGRAAIGFCITTVLYAYVIGAEETGMMPFDILAGLAFVLCVGLSGRVNFLRIVLGCLAGAAVSAMGMLCLMALHKQSGWLEGLFYTLSRQWQPLLASLAGYLAGGALARPRNSAGT